ncbi:head GIN domain-containing protein [Eudoraea chungangensis]|uniref:head GIN domain-containing protein n=1 Tax=Eudoraea chungangensis TaxID=1481905 RepID=UPI0023EE02A7|nr:head GIN domain-containing protein [Eudoraea chungangensis]
MKNLISLCFVLVTAISFAQNIVNKDVGSFSEIKVYDLIEVNLIKSDVNKIMVKGHNVYDVKFVNKNGVLKLRMDADSKFQGEDTFVEVYYTSLSVIDGNEGARIVCNELIQQNNLTLKTQEGAKIVVGMEVKDVDIRAVTGGVVEASGLAKNQIVVINTGGVFDGRGLKSEVASIKISAGGEAELYATEQVDVNVKAGGDVFVYGNPKTVNKNTLAGGRIVFKD